MFFNVLQNLFSASIMVCSLFTMSFTIFALLLSHISFFCLEITQFFSGCLLTFLFLIIGYQAITIYWIVSSGFFGEVFRGIWNGTDVAIKVFLEQDLTTENMEDFCNEIYILRYQKFSWFFYSMSYFSLYINTNCGNLFFPFSRLRHPNGNHPFWLMWNSSQTAPH